MLILGRLLDAAAQDGYVPGTTLPVHDVGSQGTGGPPAVNFAFATPPFPPLLTNAMAKANAGVCAKN